MSIYAGRRLGSAGRWWVGLGIPFWQAALLFTVFAPALFVYALWRWGREWFWIGCAICWLVGVIVYGIH